MSEKILVTYSTRTGTTKGVSEEIGKTIASLGETVDVLPMSEVTALSGYRAVIAGSAVQSGKWLPEAMDFIRKNWGLLLYSLGCLVLAGVVGFKVIQARRFAAGQSRFRKASSPLSFQSR